MRSFIPSAGVSSRSMMVAVVLGTAFTAASSKAAQGTNRTGRVLPAGEIHQDLIRDIDRYCQACWRNARLPVDRWDDCTQQVFARLLESVPAELWPAVLDADGEPRREFIRAIGAARKRAQRMRKFSELSPSLSDQRSNDSQEIQDQREALSQAAEVVLSPRQRQIVELTRNGWGVPEIAAELQTTAERVSDEKYKAIRKLRSHFDNQV